MPGTPDHSRLTAEILERVRSEYLEMPGLRLTSEQVQRLCGLDRAVCHDVLNALVEMKFLAKKPDGAYARLTDGADMSRLRVAKASLRNSTPRVPSGNAADVGRRFRQ